MPSIQSRITLVALAVAVLAIALALFIALRIGPMLRTATGSVSHALCDAAFVSRVDPDQLYAEQERPLMRGLDWALHYRIDRTRHEVRSSVLGLFGQRAVFRPGLGCLLAHGVATVPDAAGLQEALATRDTGSPRVNPGDPRIRRALDQAFAEPDPAHLRRTKAVVIWHDGRLIGERYAHGYGPDTPIWAHSVSKSITQALIGILVRQGKLRIGQPVPIAAWRSPADPHHPVTIDQLLRMTSGLPFDENDDVVNPMTRMFFLEPDMAGYAATVPLEHPPGSSWAYSNLGFVLLGRVIRDASGGNALDAERFMRRELFDPLGMHHTLMETDATGTPIAASHVYATARDLARFGQLYLDDGVVNGRRILPQGWANYAGSQTLATGYGAGFWTNRMNRGSVPVWHAPWGMPSLPRDMYYARGALGQYVVIVPSERLVVVRMGISPDYGTDTEAVIARIIDALHHPQG